LASKSWSTYAEVRNDQAAIQPTQDENPFAHLGQDRKTPSQPTQDENPSANSGQYREASDQAKMRREELPREYRGSPAPRQDSVAEWQRSSANTTHHPTASSQSVWKVSSWNTWSDQDGWASSHSTWARDHWVNQQSAAEWHEECWSKGEGGRGWSTGTTTTTWSKAEGGKAHR